MKKTSRRLADGREIVYFDSGAGVERRAQDHRDLTSADFSSELRYDPVTRTWVMYASHRQDRTYLPSAEDCPLCPTTEGHQTEVPEPNYEVVVFENRFPALSAVPPALPAVPPALPAVPPTIPAGLSPLLAERSAAGRCEVVCYTDDHTSSFAELKPQRTELVLDALVDRTAELSAMDGVEQVFCFENRGTEIGVTQPHPHGQIYAYPFIPQRAERMLASAEAHRRKWHSNLYEDLLDAERADGRRVLLSTRHWTAFVPHAARWPYEVHCYPNDRAADLGSIEGGPRSELPEVLHDIFTRFAKLFKEPAPYIAGWYQAPVRQGRAEFAMHLELFTLRRANDKLKYLAGSESGMEAFANDIVPEAAAERLREIAV